MADQERPPRPSSSASRPTARPGRSTSPSPCPCRSPGSSTSPACSTDSRRTSCRSPNSTKDAAAGTLPDFSFIEPDMASGHNDYHPAYGRSFIGANLDIGFDPPSSMLGGEAFLEQVYNTYRSMTGPSGTNVWNTALLIGWDEPGGTYDHVAPGAVPPPDEDAPAGEFGFTFDRSGYRVPAIIVSPWVDQGSVYNEEYRHTSLIATLRKTGTSARPSPGATPRRAPSTTSSPWRRPETRRAGSRSKHSPCPPGRSTFSPQGQHSAHWARSSAPA